MSLNSKGCYARITFLENYPSGNIKAKIEVNNYTEYKKNGGFFADFVGANAVFFDKGERLYTGDLVYISEFYITNRKKNEDGSYTVYKIPRINITKWKVVKHNGFTKPKSQVEYEKEKNRQRRQIEEEIEAEEQDLDEYIENNGEDDCPF